MLAASWFHRRFVETGRLPLLITFAAFIVTFLVTRTITRMIRAGRGPFHNNVSSSGLHVHHAVPGIVLLITGAFMAVGTDNDQVWTMVAAALIGIGTSLVLDEFALILHLTDVYWSDEGRISVEMVSLAVACLGLALIGVTPVRFPTSTGSTVAFVLALLSLAGHVSLILLCIAKGKYRSALFGAFIPVVAAYAAVRLARPGSRWSRRYSPERLAEARERAERWDARFGPLGDAVSDFIAGRPSQPDPPAPAATTS